MSLRKKAIKAINNHDILLVFPIKNKKDPDSLWHQLFPDVEMIWDWDEGDHRIMDVWHLMKELSQGGEVVYSKWLQNRATFFSKKFFSNLWAYFSQSYQLNRGLLPEARSLLSELEIDSPLSTRELKEATDLKGKIHASLYNKAIQQLYRRLLIVSYGEKEDSSFPSSLIGATELVFEDLVSEASHIDPQKALLEIDEVVSRSPSIGRYFKKVQSDLSSK